MLDALHRDILIVSLCVLLAISLADFYVSRARGRMVSSVVLLAGSIAFLKWSVRFPEAVIAFGGVRPLPAIAVMYICTMLGIAANYIFYLRNRFSWLAAIKPLCVTPIVLLPMLGSLQGVASMAP